MFDSNKWVYTSSLVVIAIVGFFMYARKREYSLIDVVDKTHRRDKTIYVAACIMIGYIVFWAAIRNAFVDTAAYIESYKAMDASLPFSSWWKMVDGDFVDKAPLFQTYGLLLKKLGFHWHFYLGSISVFSGICIIYGIGRYTDDVSLSVYLFVTTHSFLWLFNGIRQMIVISVMFAAFRLLYEKKLVKYLLLITVLYFIHTSCIIFIPLYFIANMKNWSIGIFTCILITMVMTLAFPGRITSLLDSSFEEYNVAEQFAEDDGANVLRFLVAMVPPVLAYMYRKRLAEFHDPKVNVLINISLISAGLYAVATVTSGIYMGRVPGYTEIFNVLFIPFLIRKTADKKDRRMLFVSCILLYLTFYIVLMKDVSYYSTDVFESLKLWDIT